MQKHRVSLLKTTTFSVAANIPESAVDSKKRTLLSICNKRRCCLKNNKDRRVIGDSKGSITVIEHELSPRMIAHGVAIIVAHHDRKLLASARLSNSKLSAEA